jgi:hypothetical protein
MKPIRTLGIALALACSTLATLAAQNEKQTETKSKITVKDGKDVTVTGCVATAPASANGAYLLTNVADKKGSLPDYTLTGKDNDDLQKHLGHRVEISGLAADRDGKVEIETKSKTKIDDGPDRESRAKATVKGDMPGLTYLKIKSLRMVAAVCP